MANRIQLRRGTSTQWNDADPILAEGELGLNTTLSAIKIGDGSTEWSSLDYLPTMSDLTPAEVGAIALTEKGAANGVAELDANQNVLTKTSVIFEGATENNFETTLTVTDPTTDQVITLPNVTGTVITSGDTGTVTNTMLSGSIANNKLTNSSVTVNGSSVSLGSSVTITAANPNALTIGTGLSGTSYDGSAAVTVAIDSSVVTTSGTQTLTNKNITTPTLTLSSTSSTTAGVIAFDSTNDKIIIGDGTSAIEFAPSTLLTNAQTGDTYTLVLTDKDKLIELDNASAITLNIPTNSVAYPIGTQINILQTGLGQVTIAAATPGTTTVNGTPGLKLRSQWSSATLIKRATEIWVAIGDLSE